MSVTFCWQRFHFLKQPVSIPRPKLLKNLKLQPRLILSILVSALVSTLLPSWLYLPTRILCLWNSGMFCFLFLTLSVIMRATPEKMRRNAQAQDEGRLVILILITAAACASLLAIGFLLKDSKGVSTTVLTLHVALSVLTIIGSWLLLHTIFALHYAHGYYQNGRTLPECKAEGLDFPNDIEPDYWDFLYFSFVIGMTSQVSDVQITSRAMRRLALLHGVLSFFFNTTLLAMSINIVAGLL